MLQIKLWSFNIVKPHGYTPQKIEKEINAFLKNNTIIDDSFEMWEVGTSLMMAKVLYKKRKTKKK